MKDLDLIIPFLSCDAAVSGAEMGRELGLSRMAIQKKIQALSDLGLPIKASRGVGYQLESGVSLLRSDKILDHILPSLQAIIKELQVHQAISSTNTHLLAGEFDVGLARVCIAESQSAGRGRRGNHWQSTPYRNIMLSIGWGFERWPPTITGLGLAVGLVVAEYLNSQHNLGVSIKWPNDLLVGEKKLGGILVDVAGEASGACNVVIGLGLNVNQANWSSEADYQWQDLAGLGVSIDRNLLAADLISVITAMLLEFSKTGFSPLTERWNKLSSFSNKVIRVGLPEDALVGRMKGVDELGALLLEVDGRIVRVDDSAMSVRLVNPDVIAD